MHDWRLGVMLTRQIARAPLLAPTEDVKWAAVKEVSHGGGLTELPIGMACDECYKIGVDILHYDNFEAFVSAFQDDDGGDLYEKVSTIRANLHAPGRSLDYDASDTYKTYIVECEVSKVFRGYDAAAWKRKMNATRLTNRMVDKILVVDGPNMFQPGDHEKYYLFKRPEVVPPDDEGVDLTLGAKVKSSNSTATLAHSRSTWASHAMETFKNVATSDSATAPLLTAAKRKLPFVDDHVELVCNPTGKLGKARLDGSRPAAGGVKGRAATEFESDGLDLSEGEGTEDMHADLTDQVLRSTPNKRKPLALSICGDGDRSDYTARDDEEDEFEEDNADTGIVLSVPLRVEGKLDRSGLGKNSHGLERTCLGKWPWADVGGLPQ